MRTRIMLAELVLAGALLGGCSSPPPPQGVAAPVQTQADKELALYRSLQQQKAWELAAPIGNEIMARFPGTAAAKEVSGTLADTSAKAAAIVARRRMQRLWSYDVGSESGGAQSTASLYSNDTAAADRVRLILRRHSQWGQSVYLFGSGKGFQCRGTCALPVHFDDKPAERIRAYRPPTGEPALFISDDAAFIGKLRSAQQIRIDVDETGKGPRTLVFDVGGFDPARFAPLPHGK